MIQDVTISVLLAFLLTSVLASFGIYVPPTTLNGFLFGFFTSTIYIFGLKEWFQKASMTFYEMLVIPPVVICFFELYLMYFIGLLPGGNDMVEAIFWLLHTFIILMIYLGVFMFRGGYFLHWKEKFAKV